MAVDDDVMSDDVSDVSAAAAAAAAAASASASASAAYAIICIHCSPTQRHGPTPSVASDKAV